MSADQTMTSASATNSPINSAMNSPATKPAVAPTNSATAAMPSTPPSAASPASNTPLPAEVTAFLALFAQKLSGLTSSAKPNINELTKLAEQNRTHHDAIMQLIVNAIASRPSAEKRLPLFHLLDSMLKNIKITVRFRAASHHYMSAPFVETYRLACQSSNDTTRQQLAKLHSLWQPDKHWRKKEWNDIKQRMTDADANRISVTQSSSSSSRLNKRSALPAEDESANTTNGNKRVRTSSSADSDPRTRSRTAAAASALVAPINSMHIQSPLAQPTIVMPTDPIVSSSVVMSPQIAAVLKQLESHLLYFPQLHPMLSDLKLHVQAGSSPAVIAAKVAAFRNAIQSATEMKNRSDPAKQNAALMSLDDQPPPLQSVPNTNPMPVPMPGAHSQVNRAGAMPLQQQRHPSMTGPGRVSDKKLIARFCLDLCAFDRFQFQFTLRLCSAISFALLVSLRLQSLSASVLVQCDEGAKHCTLN